MKTQFIFISPKFRYTTNFYCMKKKIDSRNPFGVYEIRLSLDGINDKFSLCEQERFSNHTDACRYVYSLNNDLHKYCKCKYYVVYNPPTKEFIEKIRASIFAPNRQIKREEKTTLVIK